MWDNKLIHPMTKQFHICPAFIDLWYHWSKFAGQIMIWSMIHDITGRNLLVKLWFMMPYVTSPCKTTPALVGVLVKPPPPPIQPHYSDVNNLPGHERVKRHERVKKRAYEQCLQEIEHASFTPLLNAMKTFRRSQNINSGLCLWLKAII